MSRILKIDEMSVRHQDVILNAHNKHIIQVENKKKQTKKMEQLAVQKEGNEILKCCNNIFKKQANLIDALDTYAYIFNIGGVEINNNSFKTELDSFASPAYSNNGGFMLFITNPDEGREGIPCLRFSSNYINYYIDIHPDYDDVDSGYIWMDATPKNETDTPMILYTNEPTYNLKHFVVDLSYDSIMKSVCCIIGCELEYTDYMKRALSELNKKVDEFLNNFFKCVKNLK